MSRSIKAVEAIKTAGKAAERDKRIFQKRDSPGMKLMPNRISRGRTQSTNKNRAKNKKSPNFISQGIRSMKEGLVAKNNHSMNP